MIDDLAGEVFTQLRDMPLSNQEIQQLEKSTGKEEFVRAGFRIIVERNREHLVSFWRAVVVLEKADDHRIEVALAKARIEGVTFDPFAVEQTDPQIFETIRNGFRWFGTFCPQSRRVAGMLEIGVPMNGLESEVVAAIAEIDDWLDGQEDETKHTAPAIVTPQHDKAPKRRGRRSDQTTDQKIANEYDNGLENGLWNSIAEFAKHKKRDRSTVSKAITRGRQV